MFQYISGLARHALTTMGGYLTASNLTTDSDWNTLTTAMMAVVGIVWSMVDKYFTNKGETLGK